MVAAEDITLTIGKCCYGGTTLLIAGVEAAVFLILLIIGIALAITMAYRSAKGDTDEGQFSETSSVLPPPAASELNGNIFTMNDNVNIRPEQISLEEPRTVRPNDWDQADDNPDFNSSSHDGAFAGPSHHVHQNPTRRAQKPPVELPPPDAMDMLSSVDSSDVRNGYENVDRDYENEEAIQKLKRDDDRAENDQDYENIQAPSDVDLNTFVPSKGKDYENKDVIEELSKQKTTRVKDYYNRDAITQHEGFR